MKLSKILTRICTVVCTTVLGTALSIGSTTAQSSRPYVVFVNGWRNCCASGMNALQSRLMSEINAELRYVPYSNFLNNVPSDDTSNDSAFLQGGADFINKELDPNRPLILIGHSFGGDSVLKLLPRINRRIQFVAVIDPVRTGGLRQTLIGLRVPDNVNYFYNRWQKNFAFPNDFIVDGTIRCSALKCDQDSQNISRNADYSPKTTECRWDEVTCPGFQAPIPFVRNGRKGTKQVRISHQDLPRDAFIQKDLGDKIKQNL
jgi:pimeloyl-ACP methyl ester carboxylesterase